jgi:hypothetical protein
MSCSSNDSVKVAFDSAWGARAVRPLQARFANDCELRAELSQRLVALASDGVTEPYELRRRVLASFPPEAKDPSVPT